MGGWQTFCVAREEMGYLCYRRNSQTFLSIAIMETNIGNMSNAPGLILTTNASKINVNAWADLCEKIFFQSKWKKKMFFFNDDGVPFLLLKEMKMIFLRHHLF